MKFDYNDTLIDKATLKELELQACSLKMIASENYVHKDILEGCVSIFSDRYAEGSIGRRFYGACENVDEIEEYACKLVQELFGTKYSFVQANSGSEANLIAYRALLNYGFIDKCLKEHYNVNSINELSKEQFNDLRHKCIDIKILTMDLKSGGHLTHGHKQNISAFMFDVYHYSLNSTLDDIDYQDLRRKALEIRPLIILGGASSFSKRINFKMLKEIADACGALLFADIAHTAGLIAGNAFEDHENPVNYADITTFTTHKTLRGCRGGVILTNNHSIFLHVKKACPYVIGGPHVNNIIGKCLTFKHALTDDFKDYVKQVLLNAKTLEYELKSKDIPICFNGTDTHMLIIDLSKYNISGRTLEKYLCSIGIIVNRNVIPNDKNTALETSGIRLGVQALTSRGMKEKEMVVISNIIHKLLSNLDKLEEIKNELINDVREITCKFGIYDLNTEYISSKLKKFTYV